MSKNKTAIRFESLHLLWQFAQRIQATSIEIKTGERLLICNCSEEELNLVKIYKGSVVEHSPA